LHPSPSSWRGQHTPNKTFESPTQPTVSGPFTLSGKGTVTFAELASGGRALSFGGNFGSTLIATGDGTFNGPMTFPTSPPTSAGRNGLGVLTPTADGFTAVVHRAASGPDAGAAFLGVATPAPILRRLEHDGERAGSGADGGGGTLRRGASAPAESSATRG
jgi:hypothetical protein